MDSPIVFVSVAFVNYLAAVSHYSVAETPQLPDLMYRRVSKLAMVII